MTGALLRDASWVRQSFLVTSADLDKVVQQNRTNTSASNKFTDTTPGGNFAVNPPPQFTRYADPKAIMDNSDGNQRFSPFAGSRGMGRYYSEAIDDNSQLIYMRFGVPQFNSLITFFTGFYDSSAGLLARTGRGDDAFYTLGRVVGFVASIIYWPLLVANMLGNGYRFFAQKPSTKFYYLKPTMPVYWNAVNTIVNHIAVNRGIIPRIGGEDKAHRFGEPFEFDSNALSLIHKMMPDIFTENGGIDVYALANRAQRLARKRRTANQAALDTGNITNLSQAIQAAERAQLVDDKKESFEDYRAKWIAAGPSKPVGASGKDDSNTEQANIDAQNSSGFLDFLKAELDDGGAFACFRVNSTGAQGESFQSTTGESQISQKMNSQVSSSRSTNFDFAGGNVIGGVLGQALGVATKAATNFASGVADSLHISGVAALGGAAFVDIPHHWQSSTAQLPRANYTIHLRSWSGNPISQLINMYVPLGMCLAGALPLSTGRHSYTSPFIAELYDQGRCQSRLCMIDSMQVTRGEGNLGFNSDGVAMGIDITFSVIDLSTIIHMPIAEGFSWSATQAGINLGAGIGGTAGVVAGGAAGGVPGAVVAGAAGAAGGAAVGGAVGTAVDAISAIGAAIKGAFNDDSPFNDYMSVIAGMSLSDQIYSWRKLKLNTTRQLAQLDTFFSTAHYASFVGESIPARMISILYKGVER